MEQLIDLPKIPDKRGNLTFLENQKQFPFKVNRVYWTYDVPGGELRGGHAYHAQQEVIIALSGSFDVIIKDKNGQERKYHLNRSYKALYVPPLTWRHMENFSTNALSLHISSHPFSESDYIRDYELFCKLNR
ncbi:sugar 3,4-ketoisomerase [Natronoflexus pectinivorans]|uniref:WxcM-like protein n=1 Tax=Natronoflexus pectinivorans TaxID=682526 RepID=A0A4R2GF64_9BACT|nr:FdtA/QdtA family cupin domain-containing protein [Natronoflexus pectinivorans]TCO06845.1 WxcM-like protein [Natronoflexus pectinivorans]